MERKEEIKKGLEEELKGAKPKQVPLTPRQEINGGSGNIQISGNNNSITTG